MDKFTANLAGGLRRFAMAGVGAISLTVDKSKEIIDQLAARGEVSAAEGQAACDDLQKKLTEQVSAFTQKLRTDYENLSFDQMLARSEKLTPEQKQRLIQKLTEEPEAEQAVPAEAAADEPETVEGEVPAEDPCAEAAPEASASKESASAEA